MMESKCKWVRLGDYIEMRHENNSSLKYGAELISISAALVLPPGYLKGVFISLINFLLILIVA